MTKMEELIAEMPPANLRSLAEGLAQWWHRDGDPETKLFDRLLGAALWDLADAVRRREAELEALDGLLVEVVDEDGDESCE